ncbi:conserved hypothetical protein [Leishmania major strain Friedlin]|uniref:Uncharacterized protein n=1 Tax=Leishmania major TaxID=5664 RepID=Q4QDJ2_LEIMA|nr:conserved hypothetical protein [Leishmania major strain Friedlin]CAG9572715.1 hypothetical_protein_-_conserved [Leishmania major strain Friedlin]CAJ07114.1 conserved hypothetical protein [Leishmania major strain Friedlin]|eukprot:XP_001682606.1 conserved hypothetical protein [Leishmania major strain Friedlin]
MCSPHWGHLCAVGFRVRMSLQGGRRVVLQKPHLLLARARQLQECTMQDSLKIPSNSTEPHSASSAKTLKDSRCTETRQRRPAGLFETWGWSPHLQQTLGATLCSAPLESVAAFRAAVEANMLAGSLCKGAQLIPVVGARGSRAMMPAPFVAGQRTAPARDGAREGWAAARCPWNTRCRVLQPPSSLRLGCSSTSAVASWVTAWTSEPMGSPPKLLHPWPAWTEAHTDRPTLRLFGLPASVRAAFLDVPFPSPSTSSSLPTPAALMEAACGAALAQLAGQVQDAVEHGQLAATSRLYFCPLAHAVDYSGTLDLRAFAVEWGRRHCDGGSGGGASAAPRTTAVLSDSSPVLSLGAELPISDDADPADAAAGRAASTPPLRVVVFSNAHMLSKRAIRRLLDQWTRNGASVRKLRQQQERAQAGPREWRTLMGSRLLLPLDAAAILPHVRSLSIPFGDVQAVFIGYTASQGPVEGAKVMNSPLDAGRHAPLPLPVLPPSTTPVGFPVRVELAVSTSAHADLLHVEEPLSAALLRASTLYRRCLDAAQRRELVEAVVQSTVDGAPAGAVFAKRQSQRLSSGRIFFETSKVPLTGTQGRLQLHEACEAALSLLSPLESLLHPHLGTERARGNRPARDDDVVSLLVMYPLLSTVHIRHVLLSAFHVRVTPTSTAGDEAPPAVAAAAAAAAVDGPVAAAEMVCLRGGNDRTTAGAATPPPSDPRVRFVASRLRANEHEQRERDVLLQAAKVRAAAAAAVTATPSCAPRAPLLFQAYAAHVEPAVLLGLWTPTLLFRAPTLADVMALRCFLLEPLRTSYAASHRTPTEALPRANFADGGGGGGMIALRVDDVDVIHFDYADGATRHRRTHRLFGVRASLCPASAATPPPRTGAGAVGEESLRDASGRNLVARELALLETLLQQCLKECARAATFFPLWTEHRRYGDAAPCATTHQNSEAGPMTNHGDGGPAGLNLLPFPFFPSSTNHRSLLDFPGVTESLASWAPRSTELRLLSLAAAQRPSLSLTIRSRVVLLESVYVPASDEVDAPDDDAGKVAARSGRKVPNRVVARRGEVCEVAGFVPCSLLLGRGVASTASEGAGGSRSRDESATREMSLPRLVRQQVAGWSLTERRLIEHYMAQQQHASALPLLRCCAAPQPRREDHLRQPSTSLFVLPPRCTVVGGYRSLHYYGLPLLHLPLLILAGGLARAQPPHSAVSPSKLSKTALGSCKASRASASDSDIGAPPALLTATSPSASFDYALPHLFHPHHADPASCRATLCLTSQERQQALDLLFAQLRDATAAVSDGVKAACGNDAAPRSLISFVEDVLFTEMSDGTRNKKSADALTAGDRNSSDAHAVLTPPVCCPLLTEMALYSHVR